MNAKRTGILCDLGCDHVRKAKTEGPTKVVTVDEGKTFSTYGGSGVYFSEEDYTLLLYCMEVNHIRSKSGQVFCRDDGAFADTTEINQFLQTAVHDYCATYALEIPHVTCSLIRKTWVTQSRENSLSREDQRLMARHMDHNIHTADKSYDTSTAVKTTPKLFVCFIA